MKTNLLKLINSEQQCSAFILDQLHFTASNFPDVTLHDLYAFQHAIKIIIEIGEIEHTGDWDPYLIITLKDESQISTPNGYYEFEIDESSNSIIIITDLDEESPVEDLTRTVIDISDIKSITINR